MTKEGLDIVISLAKIVPQRIRGEIASAFKKTGLRASIENREEVVEVFEWVIPMAIVILITPKYFEVVKDHHALKIALRRLLRRTCGPERDFTVRDTSSSSAEASPQEGPVVSIMVIAKDEHKVRFTFSPELETKLHSPSIDSLFQLVEDHYQNFPADSLSRQIEGLESGNPRDIFIRYDQEELRWEVADFIKGVRKQIESLRNKPKTVRTVRIIIEDGLGFPSGTVWPASYVCVIFCNVPDTWLNGDQGLKDEKRERLLEHQYGKTWRRGNDDGSRYVIRRFEVDVLESAEALERAKLSIDEGNAQMRYWFYLIDDEERLEKVDKDTFFDNSM